MGAVLTPLCLNPSHQPVRSERNLSMRQILIVVLGCVLLAGCQQTKGQRFSFLAPHSTRIPAPRTGSIGTASRYYSDTKQSVSSRTDSAGWQANGSGETAENLPVRKAASSSRENDRFLPSAPRRKFSASIGSEPEERPQPGVRRTSFETTGSSLRLKGMPVTDATPPAPREIRLPNEGVDISHLSNAIRAANPTNQSTSVGISSSSGWQSR